MTAPQKVTERYAMNLLRRGQNNEFLLSTMELKHAIVEDISVGIYFECTLSAQTDHKIRIVAGVTPLQALRRALEKFGVTFR